MIIITTKPQCMDLKNLDAGKAFRQLELVPLWIEILTTCRKSRVQMCRDSFTHMMRCPCIERFHPHRIKNVYATERAITATSCMKHWVFLQLENLCDFAIYVENEYENDDEKSQCSSKISQTSYCSVQTSKTSQKFQKSVQHNSAARNI